MSVDSQLFSLFNDLIYDNTTEKVLKFASKHFELIPYFIEYVCKYCDPKKNPNVYTAIYALVDHSRRTGIEGRIGSYYYNTCIYFAFIYGNENMYVWASVYANPDNTYSNLRYNTIHRRLITNYQFIRIVLALRLRKNVPYTLTYKIFEMIISLKSMPVFKYLYQYFPSDYIEYIYTDNCQCVLGPEYMEWIEYMSYNI